MLFPSVFLTFVPDFFLLYLHPPPLRKLLWNQGVIAGNSEDFFPGDRLPGPFPFSASTTMVPFPAFKGTLSLGNVFVFFITDPQILWDYAFTEARRFGVHPNRPFDSFSGEHSPAGRFLSTAPQDNGSPFPFWAGLTRFPAHTFPTLASLLLIHVLGFFNRTSVGGPSRGPMGSLNPPSHVP